MAGLGRGGTAAQELGLMAADPIPEMSEPEDSPSASSRPGTRERSPRNQLSMLIAWKAEQFLGCGIQGRRSANRSATAPAGQPNHGFH